MALNVPPEMLTFPILSETPPLNVPPEIFNDIGPGI